MLLLSLLPALFAADLAAAPSVVDTVASVRDFTLGYVPPASGPYRAEVGPIQLRRLMVMLTLPPAKLSVVEVAPDQLRVSAGLVVRVNSPSQPFRVIADLEVTEARCEGWARPVVVPVEIDVTLRRAPREGGGEVVVAEVALANDPVTGLPLSDAIFLCDLGWAAGMLVEAGAGYIQGSADVYLDGYAMGLTRHLSAQTEPPPATP
jgi:hypothetical protein